ncbi:MAG: VOC family protein [Betaproteobacteria bacterium]|nr:VOC family protein [Betaproteobacteria bacterium]
MIATPLIDTTAFSHGTLECRNGAKTQRFYKEFLGVHAVRRRTGNQYIWQGGEWVVVCIAVDKAGRPEQGIENRWGLRVGSRGDVETAHAAALAQQGKWGMRRIMPVQTAEDGVSFRPQDLDGNWWEIGWHAPDYYDKLFARGDLA